MWVEAVVDYTEEDRYNPVRDWFECESVRNEFNGRFLAVSTAIRTIFLSIQSSYEQRVLVQVSAR